MYQKPIKPRETCQKSCFTGVFKSIYNRAKPKNMDLTVTIKNIDEEFVNNFYSALIENHLKQFSVICSFPADHKYEFNFLDIAHSNLIPEITACLSAIQAVDQRL